MSPGIHLTSVSRMRKAHSQANQSRQPAGLGLPIPVVVGLALLGVPRVVLHDLGVIQEGTAANGALVFVPPLIWILVAVLARVPKPFLTMLATGAVYGAFLVIVHQVLWTTSFGGNPPTLGGNLEDLDPTMQNIVLRVFSVPTGLITGVVVGALSGTVAWGVRAAVRRSSVNSSTR